MLVVLDFFYLCIFPHNRILSAISAETSDHQLFCCYTLRSGIILTVGRAVCSKYGCLLLPTIFSLILILPSFEQQVILSVTV